jgi:hypothetical protein
MPQCSKCREIISKGSYCNDCLRFHRRENNDVNLFSWVLDNNNSKPCPLCLKLIEHTCEVELHHKYGDTWSHHEKRNASSNIKLKEIRKWQKAGKIPDNIIVMHKQCHASLNFVDPFEVARYYPNHIDKLGKLIYNSFKQAYINYVNDNSLKEWEKRRFSLMGKFARENYTRNILAIKKRFNLNFEILLDLDLNNEGLNGKKPKLQTILNEWKF